MNANNIRAENLKVLEAVRPMSSDANKRLMPHEAAANPSLYIHRDEVE